MNILWSINVWMVEGNQTSTINETELDYCRCVLRGELFRGEEREGEVERARERG